MGARALLGLPDSSVKAVKNRFLPAGGRPERGLGIHGVVPCPRSGLCPDL